MLLRILLLSLVASLHFVNSENHEVEEIESVQLIGQADGDETPDEFEPESDRVEQVLTDREGVPPPSLDGDKLFNIPTIPVDEIDDGVVNAGLGLVVSNSNKWLPKRTLSFKVQSAEHRLDDQDPGKQIFKLQVFFNPDLKDSVVCNLNVVKTTKIEIITVDIWKWKITKTSYSTSGSCMPVPIVGEPAILDDSPSKDAEDTDAADEPKSARSSLFYSWRCDLHKNSGYKCLGKKSSIKYYFNRYNGRCEPFTYKGCGGNQNRFNTYYACMGSCGIYYRHPRPYLSATCKLPKKYGTCNSHLKRYWYNKYTGNCEKFTYKGCNGNSNNFKSYWQCKSRCMHGYYWNYYNYPWGFKK